MRWVVIVLTCLLGLPSLAAGDGRPVLVVGDSLARGLQPTLGSLIAPRQLVWDVDGGRTTPEGIVRLRARMSTMRPAAVLISLGTNDGPHADRFRERIRRALQAIPAGICVVWADLDRPPRKGPYRAMNAELARAARHDRRLVIVHWHHAVATHHVDLPDHIHPDQAGFVYRSHMYARALERGCARLAP
jgi:GDSL-like Lipase/Acylhydrolase family